MIRTDRYTHGQFEADIDKSTGQKVDLLEKFHFLGQEYTWGHVRTKLEFNLEEKCFLILAVLSAYFSITIIDSYHLSTHVSSN